MNCERIDIEIFESDEEGNDNENQQQLNKQQMQLEETPSPNIFAVAIINQYSNKIQHTISRSVVITAINYIVTTKFGGSMKQVRPTDVKIEPILSTSVQKACCLIQVDEKIIEQLKKEEQPLIISSQDQKQTIMKFEFKFFDFEEFNQCNFLSTGKFAKEFSVLKPYKETQRFTSIICAINKMDQQIYAVKKVRLSGGFSWQKLFYNQITQIREVKAMLRLQHPNVIRLYSWWIEQEVNQKNQKFLYLYLQQEYDSFLGSHDLLEFSLNFLSNASLEIRKKTLISLISQLISGLEYIHGQGFFHRDLKLENILITKDNAGDVALRICDFDWSKTHLNDDGQKINWLILSKDCGTVEINNGIKQKGIVYDATEELYSVGIIILDLCDPAQDKQERIQIHLDAKNNQFRPHMQKDYQPEIQIIQALLGKKFKSVYELRNSPLYKSYINM